MLRRFVRDSAVYGLSSIVVRGVSILLVPIYTRVLRPEDYGAVDIMTVFTTLVAVTVALEIAQALARFLPDAETADERRRLSSTALLFTVTNYTAFAVVAALLAPQLASLLLDDPAATDIVFAGLAVAWTTGIFSLLQNQLRFSLAPGQYAISSLAYSLVGIATSLFLVVVLEWSVVGVLLGQVVGGIIGIAVAAAFSHTAFGMTFDRTALREMLAFSVPLVPSSIGVFVTLYVDRAAVKELLGLEELGLYGIGYRLASLVTLLMIGFQGALVPLVYAHYRDPRTPGELARVFRVFVALAATATLGLSLFAGEILMLVTTPAYVGGAVVVPFLAPALLLSAMYVFAPGLAIAHRTGWTTVINIGGAVANLVLNLAMIPVLGIRGSALATLLSAAGIFIAYMVLSQRHYPVPHAWTGLAVIVMTVGVALFVGTQLPTIVSTPFLAKLFLFVGAAVVILAVGLGAELRARRAARTGSEGQR